MYRFRKDLSQLETDEIEELKHSLTESIEYEDAQSVSNLLNKPFEGLSVRERVNWFDARASALESKSVPSSPTTNYKFELPIRTKSVIDLRLVEPVVFNMSLSDLEPLKSSCKDLKSWISRIVKEMIK